MKVKPKFVERLSSLRGLCLNTTENLILIENSVYKYTYYLLSSYIYIYNDILQVYTHIQAMIFIITDGYNAS